MYFQIISIPAFHGGQRKFERGGTVKKEAIFRGGGRGGLLSLFPGAPSKIDVQAISYLTVNRCFKAKIIVFIDDLLFPVG